MKMEKCKDCMVLHSPENCPLKRGFECKECGIIGGQHYDGCPTLKDMNRNLKKQREILFELILREKPTAGRIYRLISLQDKEFIRKLNLEMDFLSTPNWREFNARLNELSGYEEEEKGEVKF